MLGLSQGRIPVREHDHLVTEHHRITCGALAADIRQRAGD